MSPVSSIMSSRPTRNEPEFVQTVEEVLSSISPIMDAHPEYEKVDLLKRMVEPERMFTFRVCWMDDNGELSYQPRLALPVQRRDRPVQGRPALPEERLRRRDQVPRLRADLQELPDRPAHGRREGRLRLRSRRQVRRGSHALLPELHDRAVPLHRAGHRRSRR